MHPFYVVGKGFTHAGQLAVGNSIATRAGPPVVLVRIERIHTNKSVPVYNFTIQDDHTYFVGLAHGGEWVHNAKSCLSNKRGVYSYIEKKSQLPYYGQAKNLLTRLQAEKKAGMLDSLDDPSLNIIEMPNSPKLDREVVEQQLINNAGGIQSGNVANGMNPVGISRWPGLGISPP